MSGFSEYSNHDGLGLAALVQEGEVSSAELVETAIQRIERVNPQLNAVVQTMYDEGRARAREADAVPKDERGPFHGVPLLLKDLVALYEGFPTTASSRFFKDFVAGYDSELVKRYRKAGFVVCGKTNTPELGIVAYTEPELRGPTHTPWRLGHTSGGSSGGAGAVVGAGVMPIAHGGDGGGSIRIPSSCCGIFGLKPTRGMTPAGPDASDAWGGLAIQHVLTRSVRDCAAALDATGGPERTSWYRVENHDVPFLEQAGRPGKPLRIAVSTRPHLPTDGVHSDCVAAVDDAAKLCADLGHDVFERDLQVDPAELAENFLMHLVVEVATEIELAGQALGKKPTKADFEQQTWLLNMVGRQIPAVRSKMAWKTLQRVAREVATAYEDFDVLLTPTLGLPPVKIGELKPSGVDAIAQTVVAKANLGPVLRIPGLLAQMAQKIFRFIPFTPLANVTGQPSMSVPLYWNQKNLPIGTMFTAAQGADGMLLRLAAQLEEARPWKDRRPVIHAF
ncbi:MAG: amidase [Myxococcota bacterium]